MNYVPPPNKQMYYAQVWALVQTIPYGKVATYGQIAQMISQPDGVSAEEYQLCGSRWVGLAMAACNESVPWHRVVNSQGKVSHPQAAKQKQHLIAEGVLFAKDKIALSEFQWSEPGQSSGPAQGRLF